ncbi:MAG: amidohydrolase family protein [Peptococcaceae bacterium]|nr:amidohydrolase family protein [Peptococcaceae bacterium]
MIVHNASASAKVVREMAYLGQLLVAGHSNHPSFELEECLETCRYLKEHGVIIDVSTLDTFGAKQIADSPENLYALVREGIADTISTDYAGGAHDALILCVERLVKDGICNLQSAVSMVTGNVASLIPGIASQRGTLKRGNIADIVIVEQDNISIVNKVIIGGRIVVDHGKLVFN